MTDFILMLLESINGDLTSLSASNALTGTMDSFSGSLYGYITSIQTNVALPIAYVGRCSAYLRSMMQQSNLKVPAVQQWVWKLWCICLSS